MVPATTIAYFEAGRLQFISLEQPKDQELINCPLLFKTMSEIAYVRGF